MAPALLLAGLGPLVPWRNGSLATLAKKMRWVAAAVVVLALLAPFLFGRWSLLTAAGLALAFWLFGSVAMALATRLRTQPFASVPAAFLGMCVAHAGVGVFVLGVTLVKSYESERDVRLEPGESVSLGGYQFRFDGVREVEGPNYGATRGQITVLRDGEMMRTLYPEKRIYRVQQMPMSEAAIHYGAARHLYVSLGEAVGDKAWTVRVHVKPFIGWIWIGCLIMALGGVLAASDRRYRSAARRKEALAGEAPA